MRKVFVILAMIGAAACQGDGAFWWLNKNLMKGAAESRSIKEQSAKIRTLPPRYRKESSEERPTTARNSIFVDEDEEDRKMFKYNSEPDCVCTPSYLCNENNTVITDGNGLLDERSLNICGANNVCCRLPKPTPEYLQTTTQRVTSTTRRFIPTTANRVTLPTSTTTRKTLLNFNFNNVTDFLSTILRPVSSTNSDPKPPPQRPQQLPQNCISRKGKKIEKRILIDDDYDDDSNDALVGETAFSEYPWMLEVLKKNRKTGSFEYKCGGVLISPTTALTANHCLKGAGVNPSNFLIRAGEWDRSSTLEYAPHHDRPVSQITSHPQYYSGGLFNDIAILKWQHPLEPEVNVQPLCLPEEFDAPTPGKYCIVTGWGKSSESSQTTDKLKFAKLPFVDRETCQRQFQNNRLGARFRLHESFACFGGEAGIDSCTNDGGSPLICPKSDGSYFLAGLVSWGLDCGQKDVPGAYTSIRHLLKWIKSHKKAI